MTVDEYESIRLLDLEGLTQEEAAQRMDVARTTVQRIYAAARHKVAQACTKALSCALKAGIMSCTRRTRLPTAAAAAAGSGGGLAEDTADMICKIPG